VKTFLILGSLSSFLAVALGAFAAHSLKEKLPPDMLAVFEVGVRYHLYHSLALFVVAWISSQFPGTNIPVAGWFFVAGMILFSGSLYLMSVTGMKWLGMITPLGGLCFLGGWVWIAYGVWKSTMSS
jgi:uncharacterized membrane protein YgdD (TMEM256/DUF423 family)